MANKKKEEGSEKPNDDFIIPKKFLEQLEEFSNGGFILLTFSSKGNPVAHQAFETQKDKLALEAFLFSYANRVEDKQFEEQHGVDGDDDSKE